MALSSTEKNEIEVIIRKEIKDFMKHSTIKQFEDSMMDTIAKVIKRGGLENDIKDIVVIIFREFYSFMWNNRTQWESRIKNS